MAAPNIDDSSPLNGDFYAGSVAAGIRAAQLRKHFLAVVLVEVGELCDRMLIAWTHPQIQTCLLHNRQCIVIKIEKNSRDYEMFKQQYPDVSTGSIAIIDSGTMAIVQTFKIDNEEDVCHFAQRLVAGMAAVTGAPFETNSYFPQQWNELVQQLESTKITRKMGKELHVVQMEERKKKEEKEQAAKAEEATNASFDSSSDPMEKVAQLPTESTTTVVLPDGSRLKKTFPSTSTFGEVARFVQEERSVHISDALYVVQHPIVLEVKPDNYQDTLESLGIVGRCKIIVSGQLSAKKISKGIASDSTKERDPSSAEEATSDKTPNPKGTFDAMMVNPKRNNQSSAREDIKESGKRRIKRASEQTESDGQPAKALEKSTTSSKESKTPSAGREPTESVVTIILPDGNRIKNTFALDATFADVASFAAEHYTGKQHLLFSAQHPVASDLPEDRFADSLQQLGLVGRCKVITTTEKEKEPSICEYLMSLLNPANWGRSASTADTTGGSIHPNSGSQKRRKVGRLFSSDPDDPDRESAYNGNSVEYRQ